MPAALSRNRRGREIADRLSSRPARKCDVERCFRQTHQLSRWCAKHAQNAAKHGSPTQKPLRRPDLLPWRKIAHRWIASNQTHPAIKLVVADLDRYLFESTLVQIVRRPRRVDWQAVMRLELQRLYRSNLRGQELFELVLAIHLYATARPHALQPWSRPLWFQLSRLTCRLRLRTSKVDARGPTDGYRAPIKMLETIGKDLIVRTHLVLHAVVAAMEKQAQAPAKKVAELVDAINSQAFSPPSTPSTSTPTTSGLAALNKE
jgi:hypothetical protein